jgi:phenylacetate-CoA ligase
MVIPTGPGNTELQLEFMVDFQSTVLTATSSFALLLGEEVQRRGLREKLSLRVGIFGSERWGQRMRQRIQETLGLEPFDIYGLTELYGPGMGIDCPAHEGIHFWSDYYIIEVIDPITGTVLPSGEEGEIVLTTLRKQAMPLLRYRSGDVSRILPGPCPCGSVFPRIDRLKGRTDDMIKFRGVIVYPAQFDQILAHRAGLSSEYQIVLQRHGGRENMLLRVEKQPDLSPTLEGEVVAGLLAEVKSQLAITPEVELVAYQALPRSERKTQRVVDRRDLE